MIPSLVDFLNRFFLSLSGVSRRERAHESPHLPPAPHKGTPVKLAIVVGHNHKARGAYSKYLRESEYPFNLDVAHQIAKAAEGTPVQVAIFQRKPSGSYKRELRDAYGKVDAWGADCSIELHFNAFDGPASGTETLHSTSTGSTELAQIVHHCMLDCFGLNNRGLLLRKRFGGRGWYSMYAGKAPAILIEPGFGSHAGDATALKRHWPLFVNDLLHAVQVWKSER